MLQFAPLKVIPTPGIGCLIDISGEGPCWELANKTLASGILWAGAVMFRMSVTC